MVAMLFAVGEQPACACLCVRRVYVFVYVRRAHGQYCCVTIRERPRRRSEIFTAVCPVASLRAKFSLCWLHCSCCGLVIGDLQKQKEYWMINCG